MSMYHARLLSQSKKSTASSNSLWVDAAQVLRSPPKCAASNHQSHLQRVSSVKWKPPFSNSCALLTMNRCVSASSRTLARNGSRRASARRARCISRAWRNSSSSTGSPSIVMRRKSTREGSVMIASTIDPKRKAASRSPNIGRGCRSSFKAVRSELLTSLR